MSVLVGFLFNLSVSHEKKIRLKKIKKVFFFEKNWNFFFFWIFFSAFFTLKSLPKIWIFFLNFFWHLKNMNPLWNSFLAVQNYFWVQNWFECFKSTNATTENFFLVFGHFDWFPPTLEKKKIEFWDFCPKFLQILKCQMWIFGRKCGRSAKNFGQKHLLVPYSYQKNFEQNPIITKELNVKKPTPPPNAFGGGGSGFIGHLSQLPFNMVLDLIACKIKIKKWYVCKITVGF